MGKVSLQPTVTVNGVTVTDKACTHPAEVRLRLGRSQEFLRTRLAPPDEEDDDGGSGDLRCEGDRRLSKSAISLQNGQTDGH